LCISTTLLAHTHARTHVSGVLNLKQPLKKALVKKPSMMNAAELHEARQRAKAAQMESASVITEED
jgi:hypothetical protein